MKNISDILSKLNDNKISTQQAINDINKIKYEIAEETKIDLKCAKKIKISINTHDKTNSKRTNINLPGINLKFASHILGFIIKHSTKITENNTSDLETKEIINLVKLSIKTLTKSQPFEIVHIVSEDTNIHIYTY